MKNLIEALIELEKQEKWVIFYSLHFLLFEATRSISENLIKNLNEMFKEERVEISMMIVKLRWLENFNLDDLTTIFNDKSLNLISKLESEDWLNNLYMKIKEDTTDEYAIDKVKSAVNFFLKKKEEIRKYYLDNILDHIVLCFTPYPGQN